MLRFLDRRFYIVSAVVLLAALIATISVRAKAPIADPAVDDSLAATSSHQTAVLAGGCFWGMQLVFEHVRGVVSVTAGYSGGSAKTAQYEIVSTGQTGHAESVRITYDPSKVTYGQLLKVFFSVAHNPTELNRQGPDEGTQYRSVIFYANDDQLRIARAYIAQLDQARAFSGEIVTQLTSLNAFYPAEAYHQDYAIHNPDNPYIAFNDLPKLDHLRKQLPDLYVK
jgi:peptide-methionine (S)-S-oxide reductase